MPKIIYINNDEEIELVNYNPEASKYSWFSVQTKINLADITNVHIQFEDGTKQSVDSYLAIAKMNNDIEVRESYDLYTCYDFGLDEDHNVGVAHGTFNHMNHPIKIKNYEIEIYSVEYTPIELHPGDLPNELMERVSNYIQKTKGAVWITLSVSRR